MSRGLYSSYGLYANVGRPAPYEWLQNGFPNRDDSSLAFVAGATRELTISPTGNYFEYYIDGQKFRTDGDMVAITDTEGLWAIYYDGSTLTAQASPTHAQIEALIADFAWVCLIYWDATNNLGQVFDERHGMQMSPTVHRYIHETIGTGWGEGLALNTMAVDQAGGAAAHAQFGVDAGHVYDEDLNHDLTAVAAATGLEIWYLSGASWRWTTNAGYSILTTGTGRMAWNNAGAQAELGNGNFGLCHVFGTNLVGLEAITIQGQAEYTTKKSAHEGALTEINDLILTGLPALEFKPIATVIFQTSNGYGNAVKSRVVSTDDGADYVDWRRSGVSAGGAATVDHGLLPGLTDDDHSGHPWLLGRAGGQTQIGGTAAGEDLTLQSTANATRGSILFGTSAYDEVNNRLGISIAAPVVELHVHDNSNTVGGTCLYLEGGRAGFGAGVSFVAEQNFGAFTLKEQAKIVADGTAAWAAAASTSSRLGFWTVNADVLTEKLRIEPGGGVSMGTALGNVASAILELDTTTGALLVPRMTAAQRGALGGVDGMVVYQTDAPIGWYFYDNGAWVIGSGLT